eukprot:TRINITY_DN39828_c0_g1_i1.p1 TRINITY_DN39828_c0_g1~~TRINITY_DN39828_c0_g1_i1.p1  ORF type:complete len:483 (+),score=127.10 TRINITY_DN39828_c0_g1_i1:212-1450(+)
MKASTYTSLIYTIAACNFDYSVCGRAEIASFLTRLYGWQPGIGPAFLQYDHVVLSHAEYVRMIYDVKLKRSPDIFILGNISQLVPGVVPRNTMLQLGTDDPERVKRRAVISEALGALKRHPRRPDLIIPPGVTRAGNSSEVAAVTGVNIFKWLFDVDLTEEHVRMLSEYDAIAGPVALFGRSSEDGAARAKEIYRTFGDLVGGSEIGRNFMRLAEERGMDASERLHELVCVVLFAGYGGTSTYTTTTVKRIRADPQRYVPMYKKDRDAFLKESARLAPPVGGLVYVAGPCEGDACDLSVGGELKGVKAKLTPGKLAVAFIPSANKDPSVFGGKSQSEAYALEFDPTRENLDKIMTWNGLLNDIEAGHAPPGTPGHAPRACPGAIFALQMCERVVDYFLPTAQGEGGAAAGEL